jgi:CubicO group peptidase (beta-lactamase class C family)
MPSRSSAAAFLHRGKASAAACKATVTNLLDALSVQLTKILAFKTTFPAGVAAPPYTSNCGMVMTVVVQDGTAKDAIVWTKGFDAANPANRGPVPVTGTTPFRIGSVSKILTSYPFIALADVGLVSHSSRLASFQPPSSGWSPASPPLFAGEGNTTLAQLASFLAGNQRAPSFPAVLPSQLTKGQGPSDPPLASAPGIGVDPVIGTADGYNTTTCLAVTSRTPCQSVVPQNFMPKYSNLSVGLLGVALSNIIKSGFVLSTRYTNLTDFFTREVATPLGMTSISFEVTPAMAATFPGPTSPSAANWNESPFNPIYTASRSPLNAYPGGAVSTGNDMQKLLAHLLAGTAPTMDSAHGIAPA